MKAKDITLLKEITSLESHQTDFSVDEKVKQQQQQQQFHARVNPSLKAKQVS